MTPQHLLSEICERFPEFREYWTREQNCFVDDDGSFRHHGVFSEFSQFVRANFTEFGEGQREILFRFIEDCLSDKLDDDMVDNAACTCFLENLAGEPISDVLLPYLRPKSREYFAYWNVPVKQN